MNYEQLEKTYESMRAFQLAKDLASLMIERPVEPEYDEQYLNGVAEIDTRSWDVV